MKEKVYCLHDLLSCCIGTVFNCKGTLWILISSKMSMMVCWHEKLSWGKNAWWAGAGTSKVHMRESPVHLGDISHWACLREQICSAEGGTESFWVIKGGLSCQSTGLRFYIEGCRKALQDFIMSTVDFQSLMGSIFLWSWKT